MSMSSRTFAGVKRGMKVARRVSGNKWARRAGVAGGIYGGARMANSTDRQLSGRQSMTNY